MELWYIVYTSYSSTGILVTTARAEAEAMMDYDTLSKTEGVENIHIFHGVRYVPHVTFQEAV